MKETLLYVWRLLITLLVCIPYAVYIILGIVYLYVIGLMAGDDLETLKNETSSVYDSIVSIKKLIRKIQMVDPNKDIKLSYRDVAYFTNKGAKSESFQNWLDSNHPERKE